jgi:transcription-repair coupling factor (superfamily II helicase)
MLLLNAARQTNAAKPGGITHIAARVKSVQHQQFRREREIDAFGAELVDRFGPLPPEVDHLLKVVAIKALCRRANVEKIEAGPKGAVVTLRDNTFANPEALVAYIRDQGPSARVRPDMKVVFFEDWERPEDRLKGAARILRGLVRIAEPAKAA